MVETIKWSLFMPLCLSHCPQFQWIILNIFTWHLRTVFSVYNLDRPKFGHICQHWVRQNEMVYCPKWTTNNAVFVGFCLACQGRRVAKVKSLGTFHHRFRHQFRLAMFHLYGFSTATWEIKKNMSHRKPKESKCCVDVGKQLTWKNELFKNMDEWQVDDCYLICLKLGSVPKILTWHDGPGTLSGGRPCHFFGVERLIFLGLNCWFGGSYAYDSTRTTSLFLCLNDQAARG